MMQINWFNELFYSTELWGYLGPLGLILLGAYITRQDKNMGVGYYVVLLLMLAFYYLPQITTYFVQVGILLVGGAMACIVPQFKRH